MPTDNRTNIKNFGAIGDGIADDTAAIQKAVNFCIKYPALASTLRIPIGNYRITKPILLDNHGNFFTIRITGDLNNKSASDPYLSRITCDFKESYAIGIQLARSVELENFTILGKFQFPYSVNNSNIGTLKFQDWADAAIAEGITDSRYAPYAGISVDPLPNVTGSGGSSDITFRNMAVKQFMVGIALTPNDSTLNDEMINIWDCDLEANRVDIAIGQDQSKTISIKGLKAWASVHTILDGLSYGRGTGGGSVFCENWNIAGNVNQLFNLNTDRFPLSCMNLYSESIFRIGSVGNGAGANFINTQIDFLTNPGWPSADYILLGQANFIGGCLRYYNGSTTQRMNFCNINGIFRDMVLSTAPFTVGLYGNNLNYPTPHFNNIHYYYNSDQEVLIQIYPSNAAINRTNWTAEITGVPEAEMGDYILASPNSSSRTYWDNPSTCNTKVFGRVIAITGDNLTLDELAVNIIDGQAYDSWYISRLKP